MMKNLEVMKMAYRTKIYNIVNKKYLEPIMKFIGLIVDHDNEICSMLAWSGDSEEEEYDSRHKTYKKGKPRYFINDKREPPKIYTFLESQDEFLRYKKNNDKLEYFNPLCKWNNAQHLLMLCIPTIYERYCITKESDDVLDYIDELLFDRVITSQEEILKAINIKYFPVELDTETGDKIYHYEIRIRRDNGEENILVSKSPNRCVCLLMLITRIISLIDDLYTEEELIGLQVQMTKDLELYIKERDLNNRDLKKIKIETKVDLTQNVDEDEEIDIFETQDIEDIVNTSDNVSDKNEMEGYTPEKKREETPIDITETYRDEIGLQFHNNGLDDPLMELDYDFI